MNAFDTITLENFINYYHNKLDEKLPAHPAYITIFKNTTNITFSSTLKTLTKSHSSPLPLYFDSTQSMRVISRQEMKIKEIFTFMDVCNIGRIDAYEFLTPLSLLTKGDFTYYWDLIVENFGVEEKDFISSDEFWYFIDSLFRGLGKLLVRTEDLVAANNLNE